MSIIVLEKFTINTQELNALAGYLNVVSRLLVNAGGRVAKRLELNDAAFDNSSTQSLVFIVYPDRSSLDAVLKSHAYKSALPLREKAFTSYSMNIVEQSGVTWFSE